MIDRLENGDYHVLKDGTLIRKPINYRDLSVGAAIAYDKRCLGRGDPTSRTERVTIEIQLQRLDTYFKEVTTDDKANGILKTQPVITY